MNTLSLRQNLQKLCARIARRPFIIFYDIFLWLGLACAIAFTLIYFGFLAYGLWRGNAWPACEVFYHFPRLATAFLSFLPQKCLLAYAFCGYGFSLILAGAQKEIRLPHLGKLCAAFSLPLLLAVFLASWGASLFTQYQNPSAVASLVPYSDAAGHYALTFSYLLDGIMPEWVLRRPMAALLGSAMAGLGNGIPAAVLFLRCCLAAISLWALSWSVKKSFGIWAAMASAGFAWHYAFFYLPLYLVEIFGFTWSCLAVALWLESMRRDSLPFALAALTTTAIALMVRMGSMFLIPFFALFIFWRWGGSKKKAVAALLAAVLCAVFLANKALLYRGDGTQELGSNFSYSLAGLSLGGDWSTARDKYADEIKGLSGKQMSQILYKKAFENIRANPEIFLHRLWQGEKEFWKNIIPWLVPWPKPLLLTGLLLIVHFFHFPLTLRLFWLTFWLGVAFSIPFIYFDDSWRVNIVAYPFMAAFLGLALAMPRRCQNTQARDGKALWLAATLCCLMALTAFWPNAFRVSHLAEIREFLQTAPSPGPDQNYAIGAGKNIGIIIGDGDSPPLKMSLNSFEELNNSGFWELAEASKAANFPTVPFAVITQPTPGGNYYIIAPPRMLEDRSVLLWKITTEPLGNTVWRKVIECEPVLPAR